MKRDSYSDQQARASFQPRSPQSAIEPSQFGQPLSHSSSTSNLGANWLNKASGWVANKFQTAQSFVNGSGDAVAADQILPALRGTASTNQPLVGVIDSGFGTNEHGSKIVEAIQQENPQAQIWKGDGVGTGNWSESLVEFVDTAKTSGHSRAVANLSFDLTEVHPDGSLSTRSELTAEEQSALTYARNNGVLVVASSGNQGGAMSALGQAPQPSDGLIVVGAATGRDRASYSSYGKGLDLVAEVGSAGTSLAAAKVTGTIANIWSTNPGLSDQQVSQILTATPTDLNKPGWDAETGSGLLNAKGAIDLAQRTAPESRAFSGAQLIQQAGGATWRSQNGAIASERTAGFGDWVHGALDVAGFIPGVGAIADGANAVLYAAEGDYANAALSAAAAVPGIGDAAAAVKLANRGVQAVRAANRGVRAAEGASAARAIASRPGSVRPPAPARSASSRSTSPSGSRRPGLSRPPAAPGRQRPASNRPVSLGARRKPDVAMRQGREPIAVSSRRPSVKPQERQPSVAIARPASRRQPSHQPELGATRRPQPSQQSTSPVLARGGGSNRSAGQASNPQPPRGNSGGGGNKPPTPFGSRQPNSPRRLAIEAPPRRLAIEGRTTARPLHERGARLEPGQRSMTREQWKKLHGDQRANQNVQRLPGHGHGRHNSQVSRQQLTDRVQQGSLPNGTTAPAPSRATRFDSARRELEAVGRARAQLRAAGERPIHRVNSRGEVDLDKSRTYLVPGSRDGYGRGVEVRRGVAARGARDYRVNSNGEVKGRGRANIGNQPSPLPGRPVRPTGQASHARVSFEYDFLTGRWKEKTHFPDFPDRAR